MIKWEKKKDLIKKNLENSNKYYNIIDLIFSKKGIEKINKWTIQNIKKIIDMTKKIVYTWYVITNYIPNRDMIQW